MLLLINAIASFEESRRWGKGMIEGNFASKNLFYKHKCVFGGGGRVEDGREIGKSFQIDV